MKTQKLLNKIKGLFIHFLFKYQTWLKSYRVNKTIFR